MLGRTNQFREKLIAKVPTTILENAHFNTKQWERTFNISSWVRFHSPGENDITLILKFIDEEGAKEISIDHCQTELETTVLLSAQITFEGQGKVNEMSLYLQVSDNSVPYIVDELYIQNAGDNVHSEHAKIISAA